MKKKLLIFLVCVLIAGCKGKNNQNNTVEKMPDKKQIINVEKEKFEKEVDFISVKEEIGEVELTWEMNDTEGVKEIMVDMRIGAKRKIVRLPLEQKKYIIKSKPLQEIKFEVMPLSHKDTKGNKKTIKATPKLEHTLINTEEYIDISEDTVKLLFKTNYDATVNVYIGTSKEDLQLIKSFEKYDFRRNEGCKISNLVPEQTYYYKVESILEDKKLESEIKTFKKIYIPKEVSKTEWPKDAIFYEIFVRSFYDSDGDGIGDFKGVAEKLDYLKDMGIDGIWLMPTMKSDTYHGYDIVDYYNVEDDYGTMEDFEYLLKKAKEKNIKIIIDLVVNHSSIDTMWMKEAEKGEDNFYRNYYVWKTPFENVEAIGEWGQELWYYNDHNDYYYAVFWSRMPDLNFRNKYVREEMKNIAEFWLDKGVDGFRLDASKHIDDADADVTYAWWKDFAAFVKSKNKDAFLVGENWTSNLSYIGKFYESLDSSFNFKLSDGLVDMLLGKSFDPIATINEAKGVFKKYSENYTDTTFLRNHDMDRIATILKNDERKMKLAASLLMTLPGTPFLYYGEEIGQNGKKPDENIREPFDWYKNMEGKGMTTMEKGGFFGNMRYTKPNDGISLEEQKDDEKSLYNHYKNMIKIRKENPVMFEGSYEKIESEAGLYAYTINGNGEFILVIHNFSDEEKEIKFKSIDITKFYNVLNKKDVKNDEKISAYESLIIKYKH